MQNTLLFLVSRFVLYFSSLFDIFEPGIFGYICHWRFIHSFVCFIFTSSDRGDNAFKTLWLLFFVLLLFIPQTQPYTEQIQTPSIYIYIYIYLQFNFTVCCVCCRTNCAQKCCSSNSNSNRANNFWTYANNMRWKWIFRLEWTNKQLDIKTKKYTYRNRVWWS